MTNRNHDRDLHDVQNHWIPEVMATCPGAPFFVIGTRDSLPGRTAINPTIRWGKVAGRNVTFGYIDCDVGDSGMVSRVFNEVRVDAVYDLKWNSSG